MPNASLLQPHSDPIALSNFFIAFINYIPIDIKLQFLQDKKQNLWLYFCTSYLVLLLSFSRQLQDPPSHCPAISPCPSKKNVALTLPLQ